MWSDWDPEDWDTYNERFGEPRQQGFGEHYMRPRPVPPVEREQENE
jgi:hypothetical protein